MVNVTHDADDRRSCLHILFGVIFLQHPDGASRVFIVLYGMLLILVGLAGLITIPIVYLLFLRKGKDEDDGNDSNSGES